MAEENEIKKGARNNRMDQSRIQDIHDMAVMNGATCNAPKSITEDGFITFGDTVKATRLDDGNVKLAGYLIRYGDSKKTDLTGDYYTKSTDFGDAEISDGWFNHRMPVRYNGKQVTYLDQLPDVKLTRDEVGIFAEIVIGARNEYEKMIAELGFAKQLGWSSGTAPHLVDRKQVGNAFEITRWKLGLDASLTPTPAEPRNGVIPIKSLITSAQDNPSDAESTSTSASGDQKKISNKESTMNEEEKNALLAQVKTIFDESRSTLRDEVRAVVKEEIQALPEVKTAMNVQVTEAAEDRPFKSIADNCLAIRSLKVNGDKADNDFPRLRYLKATGASLGVPQDGGVLLDPTLASEILTPIHEDGPFSRDARKLPVDAGSNYGWINGVDETSRVAGSRWGGIRGYRMAEGATITASKPKFRRLNWELKKYAALVVATDELLRNKAQFSAVVRTGCSEELTFMLNEDIFNGVGVAGAQGFMNSGALIAVTRDTGSKILGADISAMYSRMDLRARSRANWYVSNDAQPQLDALFAVGSTAVLFPYASIGPDGVRRLYGRPIIPTEFNESLNTSGDIVFADMSQYLMWESGTIEESTSIHVYYLTDETAFRFVYAADGMSSVASALTPLKGSTTTSPFVALGSAT